MENSTLSGNPVTDLSSVADIARPSERAGPFTESEKFVVFQIENEFFGVPAVAVKEVAQPIPVSPLPTSPAWLHGLANLRGEIVAMVNLKYRGSSAHISQKSKIVVFRPPEFDTPVGFIADKISEIVSVAKPEITPDEDPNLVGTTTVNSNKVRLFNVERLFSSLVSE